jgi:hypothetical protein
MGLRLRVLRNRSCVKGSGFSGAIFFFGIRLQQGLKSLRENSVLEGHGVSRDVPSLRDSPLNLSLPGTPVPGYRLCRPLSTSSGQALRDYFVA